jgi:demethylmenaquinone methyltransferase/2-methoxy-6-polyprenyl-1,4-benzoquinol methylase
MPEPVTSFSQTEPTSIETMFGEISDRYDSLNRYMSLGRDKFWRDCLSRRLLVIDAPGNFLDLATGTGDQLLSIKKIHPFAHVTGLDFAKPMLGLAEEKIRVAFDDADITDPLPILVQGDAVSPDLPGASFDSISISFGLRNIHAKSALYASTLRLLKPGGRFLALEVFFEPRSLFAPIRSFYLTTAIPFLAGQIFQSSKEAYKYLADSVLKFPHPARIIDGLAKAGFVNLGYRNYTFNAATVIWGHKPVTNNPLTHKTINNDQGDNLS